MMRIQDHVKILIGIYIFTYTLSVILLLGIFLYAPPDLLRRSTWALTLNQMSLMSITVAWAFSMAGQRARLTLPAITVIFTITGTVNVVSHAIAYQSVGIAATKGVITDVAFSDALYFSIVTFTTLGYGDFQPVPEFRIVAALQALSGYIFLGLFIGLVANVASTPRNRRR